MILILTEKYDKPTENVISELENHNAEYAVIYGSDFLEKPFQIDINKRDISLNGDKIDRINIVWYRRWLNQDYKFSENHEEQIYLKREFEELASNFMHNLPTNRWLNIPPFINSHPTKAHQLKKAQDLGLKIPNTTITNNVFSLQEFYKQNNHNIISKNLCNPYFYNKGNQYFTTFTTKINQNDIDNQENIYFPSLFQNNITKNVEIRIFYFLKKFYCYAIFSSKNQQTNIDYRVYDYKSPNRIMKYELPKEIKTKLIHLMEFFSLHTGSIDMIKDDNDDFYFLEVNPQGQFGGMSEYGLFIEKDIANYLYKIDT